MKWFSALILLAAVGWGVAKWPKPKPRERRLAPPGVFYLVEYASVQTPRGVIGFEPGQEMRFVSATNRTLKVTDGKFQVDVVPSQLTNDLDIATLVRQRDDFSQRQLAAYQSAELEAYQQSQREFNLQHSLRVDAANRQHLADSAVGGGSSKLNEPSRWVSGYAYRPSYYYGGAYSYLQSSGPIPGPTVALDPRANGYNVNDWNR